MLAPVVVLALGCVDRLHPVESPTPAVDPPADDGSETLPGDTGADDTGPVVVDTAAPPPDPGPYAFALVALGFGKTGRLIYVRVVDDAGGGVVLDDTVREEFVGGDEIWPSLLEAGHTYTVSLFYDRDEDAVCEVLADASPDLGWVQATGLVEADVAILLVNTDAPDPAACTAWAPLAAP